MFIYKKHINNYKKRYLSIIKNTNTSLYNEAQDFFNALVFPNHINHIIGIYMIFDKEIDDKNDLYVKTIFEKYIDEGFTNVMHHENNSCLIIRFNIEYDILCEQIMKIYKELIERDIHMKCSVIYTDKNIDYNIFYKDLKEYITSIESKNEILCSNYYDYIFKTKANKYVEQ